MPRLEDLQRASCRASDAASPSRAPAASTAVAMASADPESNKPRPIKKQLSSGKLLLDDTGWLAPLNKMVWKSPNFMLYVMLIIGTVVYFAVKQGGYSTGSVRANFDASSSRILRPRSSPRPRRPAPSRRSSLRIPRTETDAMDVHERRRSPRLTRTVRRACAR